jgi:hypothetical protein
MALFLSKGERKMELSHQEFAATWRHHFKQPVHPLAEKLLAASKRTVWLKDYDNEEVAWRLEENVSFTIAFFLPCGSDEWQVQLPSAFYVWAAKVPPSQPWMHDGKPPGSNFATEYAKWTRHSHPDLFCALDVTLDADGVRLAAFFGGEPCE